MSRRWTADDLWFRSSGGYCWESLRNVMIGGVILLRCFAWFVIGLYFDISSASGVVILLASPWFPQDCSDNLFEVHWKILICDLSVGRALTAPYFTCEWRHSIIFAISNHYQTIMLTSDKNSKLLLRSLTDLHDQNSTRQINECIRVNSFSIWTKEMHNISAQNNSQNLT